MNFKTITAAFGAIAALSACQMNGILDQNEPLIPAETRAALADSCGADDLAFMTGMRVGEVEFDARERPVRIVGPNSAVTTDLRPERLNVKIDSSERITGFSCG
ncbi:I78 family peptidase inhibitor [Lentibacter sp.]|uniref:I78 family peptidase inhibitor n=1 Tax=Lentibacter sp. TaxID=2024994 RepID=UPI003F697804